MVYRDSISQRCPSCRERLFTIHAAIFPYAPYARCRRCGGRWLSGEGVRAILGHEIAGQPFATDPRRICPRCALPMAGVLLLGIPVELCSHQHGVWLDHDALARLHDAVEKRRRESAGLLRGALAAIWRALWG
jgi:Zn-finger nucleic acid-binding protein